MKQDNIEKEEQTKNKITDDLRKHISILGPIRDWAGLKTWDH